MRYAIIFTLMVCSVGCSNLSWNLGGNVIEGNGIIVHQQVETSSHPGLELENKMRLNVVLDVTVGEQTKLEIEIDENLLPFIKHAETDGKLTIWTTGNLVSAHNMTIHYVTSQLDQLKVTGASQVTVRGLNGRNFKFENVGSHKIILDGVVGSLSLNSQGSTTLHAESLVCNSANIQLAGSNDLYLGKVNNDWVQIVTSGSSDATITGEVSNLKAISSGSGRLFLSKLIAHKARLEANGSGIAELSVRDEVSIENNGSTKVSVYGKPLRRETKGNYIDFQ